MFWFEREDVRVEGALEDPNEDSFEGFDGEWGQGREV